MTASDFSSTSPFTTVLERLLDHDVRLARPDDLPAITAIYNQNIASKRATADLLPVTVAQRQAWFDAHYDNPKRPIYVLCNEAGKIVAWGSFSDLYARPAYHISSEISVYIHEDAQKRGLGAALVDWMLQQAPSLGIHHVVALIFAHNTPSIKLFNKLGFCQWGHMPSVCDMDGFYADVVMLGRSVFTDIMQPSA
ncbi:GNAT family N-acetyltransferase [Psychrobacter aestuarii]|nr:GNAT family N-acetyltransferase [Psychrobacter aestuarii]